MLISVPMSRSSGAATPSLSVRVAPPKPSRFVMLRLKPPASTANRPTCDQGSGKGKERKESCLVSRQAVGTNSEHHTRPTTQFQSQLTPHPNFIKSIPPISPPFPRAHLLEKPGAIVVVHKGLRLRDRQLLLDRHLTQERIGSKKGGNDMKAGGRNGASETRHTVPSCEMPASQKPQPVKAIRSSQPPWVQSRQSNNRHPSPCNRAQWVETALAAAQTHLDAGNVFPGKLRRVDVRRQRLPVDVERPLTTTRAVKEVGGGGGCKVDRMRDRPAPPVRPCTHRQKLQQTPTSPRHQIIENTHTFARTRSM